MITVKTPFRMSFFGGGSDFPDFYRQHGGTVLSAAFDKFCYVTLRALPPLFDYKSEFVYSKTERVRDNTEISHPAIREAMLWQGVQGVATNRAMLSFRPTTRNIIVWKVHKTTTTYSFMKKKYACVN